MGTSSSIYIREELYSETFLEEGVLFASSIYKHNSFRYGMNKIGVRTDVSLLRYYTQRNTYY